MGSPRSGAPASPRRAGSPTATSATCSRGVVRTGSASARSRGTSLTPATIVQAWLDSPAHRQILLKRRATRTGISITTDARGNYVGVLNFSDPT
ncbi:CAP domain-containing protein [Nocardioides sp. B-3]|uniref:CAP domain-containing protein n=1 Tax=Nocardioides sp. B-3 TaxID=2895565 RepID=UPI003FA5652D